MNPVRLPPFSVPVLRWNVLAEEKKYYQNVLRMALRVEFKGETTIWVDRNVFVTFGKLRECMKPRGCIGNVFINVSVRIMFKDHRPQLWKKHFFFHKAALYFPSLYEDHWFLFIVDLKEHKFIFLDSLNFSNSNFYDYVREHMIPNFKLNWLQVIGIDVNFSTFETVYPTVPKQDNGHDCGVFVMKYMELWSTTRYQIVEKFSQKDIPNIRVQLTNKLLFSFHNKEEAT